jgi:hypothetical protein
VFEVVVVVVEVVAVVAWVQLKLLLNGSNF